MREFRLTSSHRGWPDIYDKQDETTHFDSHPLTEDDNRRTDSWYKGYTFRLTSSHRGWHYILKKFKQVLDISTHILSQRMTNMLMVQDSLLRDFDSHPLTEDDPKVHSFPEWHLNFDSHPLTEDDSLTTADVSTLSNFDSHPLTEDDN